MTLPHTGGRFKTWLVFVFTVTVLLGGNLYITVRAVRELTYSWPKSLATVMKSGLDGGTSPKGVLENEIRAPRSDDIDEVLKVNPDSFRFAAIHEETKNYTTGTYFEMSTGETPLPPASLLETAKANGNSQMIWQLNGVPMAIVIRTYNYGDVFGYVIVGQPAKPFQAQERKAVEAALALGGVAILISGIYFLKKSK